MVADPKKDVSVRIEEVSGPWIEVDLGAISHNIEQIHRFSGTRLMPVIKANAYGHGAVPVARALAGAGVDMLGVAAVDEGTELRNAGIRCPVMVYSSILPSEAEAAVRLALEPMVGNAELARALDSAAGRAGKKACVHVKVDTGMGRVGVAVSRAREFVAELMRLEHLEVRGISTHLATADEEDTGFVEEQLDLFRRVIEELELDGIRFPLRHAASSPATIRFAESRFNMVRPGLGIYGLYGSRAVPHLPGLVPVLSLHTRITFLKHVPAGTPISYGRRYTTPGPAVIATIPIGYGDGLLRALANKMEVLIGGRRCRQVGTICMDQCMVDVTHLAGDGAAEPGLGELVSVIGRQGDEEVRAEELAEKAGTISYEIVTQLSRRMPRIYNRGLLNRPTTGGDRPTRKG